MADKEPYTIVNFGVPGVAYSYCGRIQNKDIYEYLQKLENQDTKLPHCANYLFSFYKDLHSHVLIIDALDPQTNTYAIRPLCRAYTIGGCFREIKNGTCKDPFVIKNIGKVFFPDKYKDDNQR